MKHLKKTLLQAVALGVVTVGLSAHAAVYINGSINFIGGATLNGPLATATAFTEIFGPLGSGSDPVIISGTGSYASIPAGTAASFTEFAFNASGVNPLWTFTVGPTTYSFEATSVQVQTQNSLFLNLQGTGIAYVTGFDPTPGTWTITDTGVGSTFTFGSSMVIPEPSSAALLALGSLVWFIRRRLA